MTVHPMRETSPGSDDVISHTVKHFLAEGEARMWDRVPVGSVGAEEARAEAAGAGIEICSPEEIDIRWWWPPRGDLARRAHEGGYRPRYTFFIQKAPDPSGPEWEASWRGRRQLDYLGFRVVVHPKGENWQVTTSFFSPAIASKRDLPYLAFALRAFSARRNCPPDAGPGVTGSRSPS